MKCADNDGRREAESFLFVIEAAAGEQIGSFMLYEGASAERNG